MIDLSGLAEQFDEWEDGRKHSGPPENPLAEMPALVKDATGGPDGANSSPIAHDWPPFADLFSQAELPMITTNLGGIVTRFNAAAEILYGYQTQDMVGRPFVTLVPGFLRSAHEAGIVRVLRGEYYPQQITEHRHSSGNLLVVRLFVLPFRESTSTLAIGGLCYLVIDLREQIDAQYAFQQERDRLEAILETTNDAILMLDPQGRVVMVNMQFETYFAVQRYHLVGRPIDALCAILLGRPDLPDDMPNLLRTFGLDAYQSAGGDFQVAPPNFRILVWYSAPVHAHDGTAIGRLFVFRDATHEREVDRMKTEFVSLVSHELRTPLMAVSGFADFILDGDAGTVSEEVLDYVGAIKINAERLRTLINDILDLTKIESGRTDLMLSSHAIQDTVALAMLSIRPLAEAKQQRVDVEITAGLPPIWADAARLGQIITNLLSNASKYTPAGGLLVLQVGLVNTPEGMPPDAPRMDYPTFMFAVHDNGMGIDLADQQKVFARFYRTERAARAQIQGSGLGLTIVKSFVELHGGKIWLNSTPGQGTSVYFTIPFVEGV